MTESLEIVHKHIAALESYDDLPVSTELLKQCIALERRRNFRTLCWASSTFLLVILAVTALLISISLVFLKNSRKAVALAEDTVVRTRSELDEYKRRMDGVSSEAKSVGERIVSVSASLQEEKDRRGRDREALTRDLMGFSRWNESKYLAVTGTLSSVLALRGRLEELERADKARMDRLASIEKWYLQNKTRIDRLAREPMIPGSLATGSSAVEPVAAGRRSVSAGLSDVPVETRTYQNGDRYTGEFRGGMRHGSGTYLHTAGDRYEGEFLNGKREGQGVYYYANGDTYAGEFRGDRKTGQGTYTYADGTKIGGEWLNDSLLHQD